MTQCSGQKFFDHNSPHVISTPHQTHSHPDLNIYSLNLKNTREEYWKEMLERNAGEKYWIKSVWHTGDKVVSMNPAVGGRQTIN